MITPGFLQLSLVGWDRWISVEDSTEHETAWDLASLKRGCVSLTVVENEVSSLVWYTVFIYWCSCFPVIGVEDYPWRIPRSKHFGHMRKSFTEGEILYKILARTLFYSVQHFQQNSEWTNLSENVVSTARWIKKLSVLFSTKYFEILPGALLPFWKFWTPSLDVLKTYLVHLCFWGVPNGN